MRILLLFVLFFGVTFYVAAGEVVVNFADPVFVHLDIEGKGLLSEYVKVYPKIKDFYRDLRIDVDVIEEHYPSEASLRVARAGLEKASLSQDRIEEQINQWRSAPVRTERQYEVRYRADGYTRVDKQMNRSEAMVFLVAPSKGSLPQKIPDLIPTIYVTLLTPTMGYALSKDGSPSRQYFSLNAKRDLNNPKANDIELPLMYFDSAPFCVNRTPLEEVVFQRPPSIKGVPYVVNYVRQKEIDGEQIVEIKTSPVNLPDVFGEIWIDRHSWGVKQTHVRSKVISPGDSFGEIRWNRETCTYDGMVDGVPLLKTYQRSFGTYDPETQEETMSWKYSFKVTKIVPGPPDLSEFDVAQFLPPGVKIGKDIGFSRFTAFRIACIVIGVIIIIWGIYLRIRNARKG